MTKRYFKFDVFTGYETGRAYTEAQQLTYFEHLREIATATQMKILFPSEGCPIMYTDDRETVLYCHPMEITGNIDKETAKGIEKAIQSQDIYVKTICINPISNKWLFTALEEELTK